MAPRRSLTALVLACVALAAFPAAGLADGDPASDILPTIDVYTPVIPRLTAAQAKPLESLVAAAKAKGVGYKVAIIASKIDLGAIPELYGKPSQYAKFLYGEIRTFVDGERGTLLIVMPSGAGIAGRFATPAGLRAAAAIHPPANATPQQLAQSAIEAMGTIAKANGASLPSSGSSSSNLVTILAIVVIAALGLFGIALIVRGRRPPAKATGAA